MQHKCPDCGSPMVLRTTMKFTYANGKPRKFYGCKRFPVCKATHGAHPDGTPLGVPADSATKQARIALHYHFDKLWKEGGYTRYAAYQKLAVLMGMTEDEAHIGRFTKEQCEQALQLLQADQKQALQYAV